MAGWGVSHGVAVIWKLDWVGGLTSKLIYVAVGWGSSSPPGELLSFPHGNQLLLEWVTHKRGNIREQPKTSLITWSQQQYIKFVQFALFYWSQRPILLQSGGDYIGEWISGGRNHWGPSLRMPTVNEYWRMPTWRRKCQPTEAFLPGKYHGQRSLVGYSLWGGRVGHNWATKHHHHNTFLLEKSCRKSIIFKTKKFHQIQLLAPKFVRANRLEVFDCVQEKQLTHLPGMTNFVPSDYIWWKCLLFTFANQKWLPQSEHGQSDVVSWKLSEVNVSKWISTSIGSV